MDLNNINGYLMQVREKVRMEIIRQGQLIVKAYRKRNRTAQEIFFRSIVIK